MRSRLFLLFSCVLSAVFFCVESSSCYDLFVWIQSSSTQSDWDRFNWNAIKTVGFFGDINHIPGLLDYAHERGAKVVRATSMGDNSQMTNASARTEFIERELQAAIAGGYDGLNFDYEGNNPAYRDGYTDLVVETAAAFHEQIPGSEISADVPVYPNYEFRSYDYLSLAKACDYFFVMQYDAEFWNNVQCLNKPSGPNCSLACSSLEVDTYGVEAYLTLGISPSKLYLGFPWYGLFYEYVAGIPFFTGQISYKAIQDIIASQPGGELRFDEASSTWIFKCKGFCQKDNRATEIWFDDAKSLVPKYALATKYGLKGVGMWEATSASGAVGEEEMWASLCPLS